MDSRVPQFDSLLEECVVTLFTTYRGQHVCQMLEQLDLGVFSLSKTPSRIVQQVRTAWTEEALSKYIHLFFQHVWRDAGDRFAIMQYNEPAFKLQVSDLFPSEFSKARLVLNTDYDVLLDFVNTVRPQLKGLIRQAVQGSLVDPIVRKYGRVYEFHDYFHWFNLSKKKFANRDVLILNKGTPDLFHYYINSFCSKAPYDVHPLHPFLGELFEGNNNVKYQQLGTNEHVYEFDLDEETHNGSGNRTVAVDLMQQSNQRHEILTRMLNLKEIDSPHLYEQFKCMISLVDPLTQPPPSDTYVVSLDLLYKLFLAFLPKNQDTEQNDTFLLCFNMQKIITRTLWRLKCWDYAKLTSISKKQTEGDNSQYNYRDHLKEWVPNGLNTQDLELLYMVDIMAVYTIYNAYSHLPIQLNPFLSMLISLWKNLSAVLLLSLEVDRCEEANDTFDTPLLVRATIRGASALRAVVACVLNGHVRENEHDFKHEPLNTFMSPHGRKLCQGSLYADLRSHAAAMLSLGVDLEDVTELLSDLQPGDRFDEDIRYMFEYEYEDYNLVDFEDEDEDAAAAATTATASAAAITAANEGTGASQKRRCNCIFTDDKIIQSDESKVSLGGGKNRPYSVRTKSSFEFDYSGNDWRDVPRGLNLYFWPSYEFLARPGLAEFRNVSSKAAGGKLNPMESQQLLKLVASAIKIEQECIIMGTVYPQTEGIAVGDDGLLTPDNIYDAWFQDKVFDRILFMNQELAWKLMDELLMCHGYRRVLLWFVTHMELNHSVIHYIFELVMGLRGQELSADVTLEEQRKQALHNLMEIDTPNGGTLMFSRQGNLALSEIEVKMLLQEFFTNAAIFLSASESEEPESETSDVSLYSIGLVKLICFMVKTLIVNHKFEFSKSECTFELQTLLMNWLGIVPDAQELFFLLKKNISDTKTATTTTTTTSALGAPGDIFPTLTDADDDNNAVAENLSEFNKKLVMLLPRATQSEGKGSSQAIDALRNFMRKHSLSSEIPVLGRRIVRRGSQILPQATPERTVTLREYLGSYDGAVL
ncbi:CCR4-NOT core subunit CAF130 KNAG_0B00770 [Huiozyma naganishii CBS 8797]|uniref:Uncharacterized protein n=1 Tax=Huiozyma naganishii (strain ATCC MYA-139 / BCRC 22969 / CBS 8797 / KCTC 17520 / NBRC 10181 / NCYC 3082 / Yp74L-3) TaxID=1071383 RepID=J7S368_HUIN7|nr:hypothetical protein KNAG_0B00770 [Kazachstania naganishii CBS 8797]CCK68524.1 hypothetical protein KNAG_0B00770 [Kazachstania naganishii CBS 8797]